MHKVSVNQSQYSPADTPWGGKEMSLLKAVAETQKLLKAKESLAEAQT